MTKNNKVRNIPVEKGTTIITSLEANLGDYEVLYQKWVWDGISAESIIFHNDDIILLSEDEIKEEVKSSPLVKSESKLTYSKGDDYTFVNFNFEAR